MSTKSPTVGQETPTEKQPFFLLNPQSSLAALFAESSILIERIRHLAQMALNYGVANGVTETEQVSVIGVIKNIADQLDAINTRFADCEKEPETKKARIVGIVTREDVEQFASKLRMISDTGSRKDTRVASMYGMLELVELLMDAELQIPAMLVGAIEAEITRLQS